MPEIIEKVMYKCPDCGEAFDQYRGAARCAYDHAKEKAINADFESGYYTLGQIWKQYGGMMQELPEELVGITKDNCFVISYLQCCDHPAYQITHISKYGDIEVYGDGSWSGGYKSTVKFHSLKDPRPKEELWKYREKGQFRNSK